MIDTNGQTETDSVGVLVNTSDSLRAGPRGYNLLEDTSVRRKMTHFDRERAPERVVHALGSGAYGQFESYGDWSNLTSACWLQQGAVSETFTRFSVVVASVGGSEVNRDTHGFATKIYSDCGNHDLVVSTDLSNQQMKQLTQIRATIYHPSSSTMAHSSPTLFMQSSRRSTWATQLVVRLTLQPTTSSHSIQNPRSSY
jgi:hypothetical protein